jgi:hypothetical protein
MADGNGRPPSDASGTHSTSRTPGTHRIGWLVARHRGGTSPGGCQLRRGGARLRGGRASTPTRTLRAQAALARSPARPRPSPLLRQTHGRRCDALQQLQRAVLARSAGWPGRESREFSIRHNKPSETGRPRGALAARPRVGL